MFRKQQIPDNFPLTNEVRENKGQSKYTKQNKIKLKISGRTGHSTLPTTPIEHFPNTHLTPQHEPRGVGRSSHHANAKHEAPLSQIPNKSKISGDWWSDSRAWGESQILANNEHPKLAKMPPVSSHFGQPCDIN